MTSHFIWNPHLNCSQGYVYVIWEDTRDDWRRHVYFNRSTDFGMTWLPQDKCLDIGDDFSDFDSYGSCLASSGKNIYVVWSDDRNGWLDIYFNTVSTDEKILFAPQNFSGRKVSNRSLTQIETLIELSWEKNLDNQDNNINSYRIYLVGTDQFGSLSDIPIIGDIRTQGEDQKRISIQSQKEFLAEMSANTLKYWHRNVENEGSYNYLIVAVDDEGNEGLPAYLTVQ